MLHRLPSVGLAALSLMSAALLAQCPPLPGTGFDLGAGATQGAIQCLLELPSGDIVASGYFQHIGAITANACANWDGSAWHAMGLGPNSQVSALTLLPNGDLVGGGVLNGVFGCRRWDGSAWNAMPGWPVGDGVRESVCLTNGNVVAVDGSDRIHLWNGSTWSQIGAADNWVKSIALHPNGDVLFAGDFTQIGGVSSPFVARWTPSTASWSAIGNIGPAAPSAVCALPTGEIVTWGITSPPLLQWGGGGWQPFPQQPPLTPTYRSLLSVSPTGQLLLSGGDGLTTQVCRWDGTSWANGPQVDGDVNSMLQRSNGSLVLGGFFTEVRMEPGTDPIPAASIARLDCTSANVTSFGRGCYDDNRTLYEHFDTTHPFDLSQSTLRFSLAGSGYQVQHLPGPPAFHAPTTAPLAMGDDTVTADIQMPFFFLCPVFPVQAIRIGSNGFLYLRFSVNPLASTNPAAYYGNLQYLVNGAVRLAPMWGDQDPSAPGGGSVHYDVDASGQAVYATWSNVQEYGAPALRSTFQIALFSNGDVEYRYQNCAASLPVLAGWSQGNLGYQAAEHGPLDLNHDGPFQCIQISPPVLTTTAMPTLGSAATLQTSNLPGNCVLGTTVLGLTRLLPGIDLGFLGMPECLLYTSVDGLDLAFPSGGTFATQLAIPSNPALTGAQVYAQGLAWASGFNHFGVLTSNGIGLWLGQ